MAIELDPIASGYSTGKINDNFQKVEDELNNNVLRRNGLGVGEPNQMEVALDMNSHDLLNVRKIDAEDFTIGGQGATGILQRAEDAAVSSESARDESQAIATQFGDVAGAVQATTALKDEAGGYRDDSAINATASANSASNSSTSAAQASTAADRAETARDASLLSKGTWPTTAAGIGQGVAGTSALVAGSGGTNGTFALGFSGGTQVEPPQGRFVVESGAVTQVIIDYPGYYSAGTPAISFAASVGLTGASVVAVMGPNVPVGGYFSTPSPDSDEYKILYRVAAGPTAVDPKPYPSKLLVEALEQTQDDAGVHARAASLSIASGNPDPEVTNALVTKGGYFDFPRTDYLLEGVTRRDINLFSQLTATRAQSAYALNAAGVYSLFGVDVLRATDRGLLIEGAATQRIADPVNLSSGAWARLNCLPAAVAGAAPDGSGNAYDLAETVTAEFGASGIGINYPGAAIGNHCFSAHIARAGRRYAMLIVNMGSTSWAGAIDFDAAGGATITPAVGSVPVASSGIDELDDGTYRAYIGITTGAVGTLTGNIRGAGGVSWADRVYSTTAGTVFARASWAQMEDGLEPTSPILVGGGTRPADLAKITWAGNELDADAVRIEWDSESAEFTRADFSSSAQVDLVNDGSGAWLGKYIKSITLTPAQPAAFRNLSQRYEDVTKTLISGALSPLTVAVRALLAGAGKGYLNTGYAVDSVEATVNAATPYLAVIGGQYYWNGQVFSTEEALLAAAGGVKASGSVVFSGWESDVNLLGPIPFTDDFGGFEIGANGSIALVGGQLEITAGPFPTTVSRNITGYSAKALKFSAVARRGTSGGFDLMFSTVASGFGAGQLTPVTSTIASTVSVVGTAKTKQFWIGTRQLGGTSGTGYLSNPQLKEVAPSAGFPQSNATFLLSGTAPGALPSSAQVLLQGDCDRETDRLRVEWRTNGEVWLIRDFNFGFSGGAAQRIEVKIGALAINQAYKIAIGHSRTEMLGAVNGSGDKIDLVGTLGFSHLRFGRSFTGEAFLGSIDNYSVFAGCEKLGWMESATSLSTSPPVMARTARRLWLNGDSYMEASSTGIGMMLEDLGYDAINTAVGGSTFESQRDTIIGSTDLHDLTLVWWDGSENGHVNGQFAIELGQIQSVIAALGHDRWLYIRSGQIPGSAGYADMTALYNRLIELYGDIHVYDAQPVVAKFAISDPDATGYANDQADLAAGAYPRSTLYDGIHLRFDVRRAVALDKQAVIDAVSVL